MTRAVRAYHAGDLHAVDDVAVRQLSNGEFLTAAWKALREVDAGQPVTYTELADPYRKSGREPRRRAGLCP